MKKKSKVQQKKVKLTPPPVKVQVEYQNLTLKRGESIKVDSRGQIHKVGSRGKITDTGLNIQAVPKFEFNKPPRLEEVKNISSFRTKKNPKPDWLVMVFFSNWKQLLKNNGGKFKMSRTETQGPLCYYEYTFKHTGIKLVANSEHPDTLLYIVSEGVKYYNCKGRVNDDAVQTSIYLNRVKETLSVEQKKSIVNLTTPTEYEEELPERIRFRSVNSLRRFERQMLEEKIEQEIQELNDLARELNLSLMREEVKFSREQSLRAMGILPPLVHVESKDEPYTPPLGKTEARRRAEQFIAKRKAEQAKLANL